MQQRCEGLVQLASSRPGESKSSQSYDMLFTCAIDQFLARYGLLLELHELDVFQAVENDDVRLLVDRQAARRG
jgi:hypothetical protein